MKTTEFFPQAEIYQKIKRILEETLLFLGVFIEGKPKLEHIGSSAIPNALSKLDLDIQIRVTREFFKKAVEELSFWYEPHHKELWNNDFALFTEKHDGIPVDFVLTVIDSKYDNFFKVRDFFIKNPVALQKYNELKKQYEGKSYEEYSKAKSAFFGPHNELSTFKKNFSTS